MDISEKIMTLADFLSGTINPGPGGNFLYTKKSWGEIGGYWEYGAGLHEAWGFALKQLINNSKFVVLPKSFYYHRHGHESLFIREVKKENEGSKMANKMINHCLHLVEEKDIKYIKNNENTWFSDLNKHPIKIKGQEYGRNGKIIYAFNYRTTIKKIITPVLKQFRIRPIIKKYLLHINFKKEFQIFKKLTEDNNRFSLLKESKHQYLNEKTLQTKFDSHYIYHPAWAARILAETKPKKHIDISSTLNFCSIVSAFIPIEFYDFRPANLNLNNLTTRKAEITSLPFSDKSIDSLSCMHTIEHIGLGRYGDEIDPDGDLKAINELKKVLAINGDLLFVVPIGKPKIMFNAHRIYSYSQIIEYFSDFELKDFSLITDQGDFIQNSDEKTANKQNYGCGCFWFKK